VKTFETALEAYDDLLRLARDYEPDVAEGLWRPDLVRPVLADLPRGSWLVFEADDPDENDDWREIPEDDLAGLSRVVAEWADDGKGGGWGMVRVTPKLTTVELTVGGCGVSEPRPLLTCEDWPRVKKPDFGSPRLVGRAS